MDSTINKHTFCSTPEVQVSTVTMVLTFLKRVIFK
jgi:hypothetical protein